jgi:hypothetical protein
MKAKVKKCYHCNKILKRPYVCTDRYCSEKCKYLYAFLNPKRQAKPNSWTARYSEREEPLGKRTENKIYKSLK